MAVGVYHTTLYALLTPERLVFVMEWFEKWNLVNTVDLLKEK